MYQNDTQKVRCSVKGCKGFKLKDDERCLKHVQQKYVSIWHREILTENNSPVAFDDSDNQELYF